MRRPIVPAACAFALGIWLAYTIENIAFSAWIAVALVFALLSGRFWREKNKRKDFTEIIFFVSLFCFLTALGGSLLSWERADIGEIADTAGQYAQLPLTVESVSQSVAKERTALIARSEKGERVLVNVYGDMNGRFEEELSCTEDLTGRGVWVCGTTELPQKQRNPRTFDYSLYLRTRGIETVISISPSEISLRGDGFVSPALHALNIIAVFKADFLCAFANAVGEETAYLTMGMLFGDTANINEDTEEAFRKNGTSHILSVSGLHVALVYGCVQRMLRGRRSTGTSIATVVLLLLYAAASQFSPSVVRAVLMIAMHIAATRLHLNYDMLCSAAATALAALLYRPYMLFNTGFQLSYLAIFSLAVIANALGRRYNGIFLSGIAVQIGMLPATVYLFNYFSPVSLLANLPVIFISGWIIPAGLIEMGLFALGNEHLFEIGGILIKLMNDAMVFSNEIFYNDGLYVCNAVSPPIFLLILYYAAVFLGLSESALIAYKRRRFKEIAAAAAVIVLCAAIGHAACASGFERAELVFVDVGQGDCLHIKSENGKNILIDGGGSVNYDVGEKVLLPYLLKNGVRQIDYAFVTHLHTDHYEGLKTLACRGIVKKLFLYEANRLNEEKILAETGLKKENLFYLSAGMKVRIGTDTEIEVLSPERASEISYRDMLSSEDENAISLALRVTKNGLRVMMTGDIDAEGEKALIDAAPDKVKTNILKAAHHGSRYSNCDEMLTAADPACLVIQVGKNNYGHPHKTVIENCIKKGIIVYRNDEDGAIGVKEIRNGRGKIITVLREE